MFGRYSLDIEGPACAGGGWNYSKYTIFIPDKNNIIPITDEECFEGDIIGLLLRHLGIRGIIPKKLFIITLLKTSLKIIVRFIKNVLFTGPLIVVSKMALRL